jgi:alkanesulfonate monooxygenase SsuD/methylene tetrahydromethanopterin reductase-like flavin-dependent oxidoreductase (luciferase family)
VFSAKFLSTVDYLSNGRVVVGIGAGWLEPEFQALSIPFAERGARTDEAIRVFRNLWETDTSSRRALEVVRKHAHVPQGPSSRRDHSHPRRRQRRPASAAPLSWATAGTRSTLPRPSSPTA